MYSMASWVGSVTSYVVLTCFSWKQHATAAPRQVQVSQTYFYQFRLVSTSYIIQNLFKVQEKKYYHCMIVVDQLTHDLSCEVQEHNTNYTQDKSTLLHDWNCSVQIYLKIPIAIPDPFGSLKFQEALELYSAFALSSTSFWFEKEHTNSPTWHERWSTTPPYNSRT